MHTNDWMHWTRDIIVHLIILWSCASPRAQLFIVNLSFSLFRSDNSCYEVRPMHLFYSTFILYCYQKNKWNENVTRGYVSSLCQMMINFWNVKMRMWSSWFQSFETLNHKHVCGARRNSLASDTVVWHPTRTRISFAGTLLAERKRGRDSDGQGREWQCRFDTISYQCELTVKHDLATLTAPHIHMRMYLCVSVSGDSTQPWNTYEFQYTIHISYEVSAERIWICSR